MPFSLLSVDPAPFLLLPAAGRVAGPRPLAPLRLRRAPKAASVAAAAAEESSAAARGRLESLSQVAGVLGTQWGDEGKGKLVDILAQRFDVVARCQVSLTHTLVLLVLLVALLAFFSPDGVRRIAPRDERVSGAHLYAGKLANVRSSI